MAHGPTRRAVLRRAAAGTAGAAVGAGCLDRGRDGPAADDGGVGVALEPVATGFRAPVDVAFHPERDRRYVADQSGVVRVHDADGLRDEPLLDLRPQLTYGGEKGLLGIALHPGFPDDRRIVVRYSAPAGEGTPSGYSHTFTLSSFAIGADGLRAPRSSERRLLEIPQPQANHNSGAVAFGPDGLLYVGTGDGGAAHDRGRGHVEDWYGAVEGGNGQDVEANLLGAILRIDLDVPEQLREERYGVPDDNPLVGRDGLDEHYAWGLRNPWRFSFDPEGDRLDDGPDLYVGDVGQDAWEEIDLVERGGNYGWNVREGTHCFRADDCPERTPDAVRDAEPLRDPVVAYPHSGGTVTGDSVIGGYRYRGDALPGLAGDYVFGDLSLRGRLLAATPPAADDGNGAAEGASGGGAGGGDTWPLRTVPIDGDAGATPPGRLLSFGRDRDGELYLLGTGRDGGGLYRIVPA